MSDDMRFEMMKVLKGRQDKFIYYVTGLSVASIGFTVSKTYDFVPNHIRDIFLGIALIAWLLSVLVSLAWIINQSRIMEYNLEIRDLNKGFYDKAKIDIREKNAILNDRKKKIMKEAVLSEKRVVRTIILFMCGVVSFFFWRIIVVFDFLN